MNTNSEDVKQFTEECLNIKCPNQPQVMNKNSVKFIIRMVMSELDELAATVCENKVEKDVLMNESLNTRDLNHKYKSTYKNNVELIGAQADSMVDAWYYMLNITTKHGVNLSKLFDVVHKANMNKVDKITGKFNRRESDGKIVKPEGWMSPDIDGEIQNQFDNGSFH